MANFLLLAVVGLIAQLVDGSLGMAYGVTSQSLLLTVALRRRWRRRACTSLRLVRRRHQAPRTGGSATWTGRKYGRWPSLVL